jgi:hypothetical protein
MKIKIGPYKSWIGPYQIADLLQYLGFSKNSCFKLGEKLSKTYLNNICEFIDSKRKRKVNIKIDKYDIWNADYTLALIILPVLIKIKETKQGIPFVSNEDVPEELHSNDEDYFSNDSNFDLVVSKWDYVLDEMIFAFQSKHEDWESKFITGEVDIQWEKTDNEHFVQMVKGPKDTFKIDFEGREKYRKRISNGFKLFGKYYESLWT